LKKLLILSLIALSFHSFAQERIALVIGNADYKVSPLKNAINDAEDIAQALKELDFDVSLIKNANRRDMRDAIFDFSEKLNKDTVGLFYYSGHAAVYLDKNYMIPIDAISNIKKQRHLDDEGVSSNIVEMEMKYSQSKLNFIFLDACRDNPLPSDSRGIEKGLVRANKAEGTLIAYSTSPGETAADGEGRNSPYTKNLLKFINTPNQPIELMLKDVKEAVTNETSGNQLPWYESSITGNFCFNTTPEGCAKFTQVIIYDPYLEGVYDIEELVLENDDKYVGQVKDGLMHGKGVLTEPSGIKYKGEFFNGSKHGQGTILFTDGSKFEGGFFNNKKNGVGLSTFINGSTVHSRWKADKRIFSDEDSYFDGPFLVLNGDEHSSEKQLIVFEEDDDTITVPHGYGVYYDASGYSIEGEYEKGFIKEQVKFTMASGDIYTGVSSNLSGQGVFISSNGEIKEGVFQYGLLNGPGKRTWANGDVYIGKFKDGYMHGQGTKTLFHGQVRSGEYKYGRLNGYGKQLFIDGSIYEGNWLNGHASGYGTFDVPGQKGYKHKGQWKNDLKNGYGTIDGNDGNRYEGDFKDDLLHGQGKWIYADGGTYVGEFKDGHMNGYGVMDIPGLQYKGNFKKDSFHGSGVYTDKSGTYEGEFLHNDFHGEYIFTDLEGKKFIEIYENSEFISSKPYTE
jgi:hypothetical protein